MLAVLVVIGVSGLSSRLPVSPSTAALRSRPGRLLGTRLAFSSPRVRPRDPPGVAGHPRLRLPGDARDHPDHEARHMFTAPLNMALSPRERPKGAMRDAQPSSEAIDVETIGASTVEQFTWKQLDTMRARSAVAAPSVCPANQTGKPP